MSDLRALLDALDEAHAKALTIRKDYPSLPRLVQNEADVLAVWSDDATMVWQECEGEADAALIVAAVNALPALTAAVRAALALADELDSRVKPRSFHPAGTHTDGASQAFADVADRLRSTVTAALTGGQA